MPLRRVDSFRKLSSSGSPSALFSNSIQFSASSWRIGVTNSVCVQRSASAKATVYKGLRAVICGVGRRRLTLESPSTGNKNEPRASWAIRAVVQGVPSGQASMIVCSPSIYLLLAIDMHQKIFMTSRFLCPRFKVGGIAASLY